MALADAHSMHSQVSGQRLSGWFAVEPWAPARVYHNENARYTDTTLVGKDIDIATADLLERALRLFLYCTCGMEQEDPVPHGMRAAVQSVGNLTVSGIIIMTCRLVFLTGPRTSLVNSASPQPLSVRHVLFKLSRN